MTAMERWKNLVDTFLFCDNNQDLYIIGDGSPAKAAAIINAIANNLEINKKNKRLTNKALLKDIEFKINNIKNGSKDNEKEILDIISNCICYLRNNY